MRSYITLFFCVLFISQSIFAQQQVFDSLYSHSRFSELFELAKAQNGSTPANDTAWLYFALAAEKQYMPYRAIDAYNKVLKTDSGNFRALSGLYRIHVDLKNFREALQIASQMDSLVPGQLHIMYNRAWLNNKIDNFPASVAWCDSILSFSPSFERAIDLKAHSLLAMDSTSKAIELWIMLFDQNKRDQYSRQLAYVASGHEYADSVLTILKKAIKEDSVSGHLYKMIGYMEYNMKLFDESAMDLRQARYLGDSSKFTNHYLGLASFQAGDYSTAYKSLEKVPGYKEDPMLLYIYAMSYSRVYSDTTAINLLNDAFEMFYKSELFANIMNELGETNKKVGERLSQRGLADGATQYFRAAEDAYKRANAFEPSIKYDLALAILYDWWSNKPEQALSLYQQCFKEYSDTSTMKHKYIKMRIRNLKEDLHFMDGAGE